MYAGERSPRLAPPLSWARELFLNATSRLGHWAPDTWLVRGSVILHSFPLMQPCGPAATTLVLPEVEADTRQAVPPLRGCLATATASEQMEALVYKLSIEI